MKNNSFVYLHIGFSKCASTWLQSYLSHKNEVYYVEKSGFFNFNLESQYDINNSYYSFFKKANEHQVKVESDEHIILPNYHPVLKSHGTKINDAFDVISSIKKNVLNVRIILVIRNQYSLILSRYSQYVIGGGDLRFKDFFKEMIKCSIDGDNYYENYYSLIIENLYQNFGKQNVLILLQEKLNKEFTDSLNSLNEFLGISNLNIYHKNLFNQRRGLSLESLRLLRFINKTFVLEKATINCPKKAIIPQIIYINMIIRGIRLLDYYMPNKLKKSKNHLLSEDIQIELKKLFQEDNKHLPELVGFDVKKYGYI